MIVLVLGQKAATSAMIRALQVYADLLQVVEVIDVRAATRLYRNSSRPVLVLGTEDEIFGFPRLQSEITGRAIYTPETAADVAAGVAALQGTVIVRGGG